MELSNQLPGSHPLTAPVHPPERVTGPPELHHSEGRYPQGSTVALNVLMMNLEKLLALLVVLFAALLRLLLVNEGG